MSSQRETAQPANAEAAPLITLSQLAEESGIGCETAAEAVEKAGMKPVHTYNAGRHLAKLYVKWSEAQQVPS